MPVSFFHKLYAAVDGHEHPRARQRCQKRSGGGGQGTQLLTACGQTAALVQPVQGRDALPQRRHVGVVHRLLAPDGLGDVLDELARRVPQGGGAVVYRRGEGVVHIVQQQTGGFELHVIVELIVLALPCQIILIGRVLAGLTGDGNVALCLGVGDLDVVGQQVLGEQPRGQHLL